MGTRLCCHGESAASRVLPKKLGLVTYVTPSLGTSLPETLVPKLGVM